MPIIKLTHTLVSDVTHYLSNFSDESGQKYNFKELIKIIKLAHQNNPYSNNINYYSMWEEQCGINFPLMYVCSIYLYLYAKARNVDTFLFATRDCSQWYKIFKAMFPNEHSIYYNCSRNMFDIGKDTKNKYFKEYTDKCLKSTINNAIYIDIHGTGRHPLTYYKEIYKGDMPLFFLISSSYRKYDNFPTISQKQKDVDRFINLVFDARGSPIEMLNYDIVGTMKTYSRHGAIRCEPEYELKYLEPYHTCIDFAALQIKSIDPESALLKIKLNDLKILIRKIYRVIQDNKPVIANYMKHPVKHPKILNEKELNIISKK